MANPDGTCWNVYVTVSNASNCSSVGDISFEVSFSIKILKVQYTEKILTLSSELKMFLKIERHF